MTVAKPIPRHLKDWDEFTGRLASRETVEIRSRVSGYLTKISFTEGAEVKAGDLLFTIDPRPYQAAVERAEAELSRARNLAELAQVEARNAATLRAGQAISQEESERRLKSAASEEAAVHAAEAALRVAQLDLEFTEIRAPISGRISNARVTEGNLVTGGTKDATLLSTLVALDPIYCYIEVDELSSLKYRTLQREGRRTSALFEGVPAEMALADEKGWPHQGSIDFVDNQLNPATGTIRGRAVFPNPDHSMTPGFFARVRILGGEPYDGLLIADQAVGDDQGHSFVWVVDAANQAVYRPVELGPIIDGLRVVRSGLGQDDRVVINGLMSVRNGIKVKPENGEMTSLSATPAAAPPAPAKPDEKPAAESKPASPSSKS